MTATSTPGAWSPARARRWLGAVITSAMLGLGLLMLPAPIAQACTCARIGDAGAFERADAVFVGTVVDYQPPSMTEVFSSMDPALWTFEVHEVRKGVVTRPRQRVLSAVSGASCGLEIAKVGTYLVFATKAHPHIKEGSADTLFASLCGGTRALDILPAPGDTVALPQPEVGTDGDATTGRRGIALAIAALAAMGLAVQAGLRARNGYP